VLIVGAGPAGLFGAYYAGFRGMSVTLVDSLPEIGGQVSALYPEKAILDVAGFPVIKGRELVNALIEQASSANPTYLLDRTANALTATDDGVLMGLDDGSEVHAKVVVITAGIGKFTPRPLPAGDG
jgi:thioredoxin reductase (NADPH)